MSGLYLLGARSLGRPATNGETAPANPATVNPGDYGTAIAWYDPTAGAPTGYTLDGGSKVDVLKNRITAGSPMGDMTPYVAASGPAITTVGGLNALNFTAATESRLRWTGTAKAIRAFAIVFSVPAAGVSDADILLIDSSGSDQLLINDPGDPILISEAGAFIAGWLGDGLGISVGEISNAFRREIVGVRGGAADADPDTYEQGIDKAGGEVEETSLYILAGRWSGSRWELYLNSTYDRANDSEGAITTYPTTGTVWLGGCGGSSQATANVRIQHVGIFSASPGATQWTNYLSALATAFSVSLSTTRPTPPEVTASSLTVAYRGIGFVDAGTNAAAGTNAVDTSSVTITSAPTKGRVQVQDNGRIVYNPNPNQSDTADAFSYIIRDTTGIPSNEVTVSVTIEADPDAVGGGVGSADPYEGLGFGAPISGYNLYPKQMKQPGIRRTMSLVNPYQGDLESIGFNLSSNQADETLPGAATPDQGEKGGGTGWQAWRCQLVRGKAKGAGDGGNIASVPDFSYVILDQEINHNLANGQGGAGAFKRYWHKMSPWQEFVLASQIPNGSAWPNAIFFLHYNPTIDAVSGKLVRFETSGTLPGGLLTGTNYYLVAISGVKGIFRLATSLANAQAGITVSLTSSTGSGVHRLLNYVTADAATDILTINDLVPPHCGKVRFVTTGTLPGGLSTATDYWLIRVSTSEAKVATSLSNAQAGTAINITSAGTGTHRIESVAYQMEVGRHYHMVLWPQTTGAATTYLSLNQPAYRTGSSTLSSIPYTATPARHFGPYYANGNAYVLEESGSLSGTWTRHNHMHGFFDIWYQDGENIGQGYWLQNADTRNDMYVGKPTSAASTRRLRQRWRHVDGTRAYRYFWLSVYYLTGSLPSADLVVTINRVNNINTGSESVTLLKAVSLSPTSVVNDTDPDNINPWTQGTDGTFMDWCRYDLGAAGVTFTDGEDYEVVLTNADTTAGRHYLLRGATENNLVRQHYYTPGFSISTTNLWRSEAGQSNVNTPCYVEISDNAGSTWQKVAVFSNQKSLSLPAWFAKL